MCDPLDSKFRQILRSALGVSPLPSFDEVAELFPWSLLAMATDCAGGAAATRAKAANVAANALRYMSLLLTELAGRRISEAGIGRYGPACRLQKSFAVLSKQYSWRGP